VADRTGAPAGGRDVFLVCNSVDDLGGLLRWAHHLARLFVARGHRVHLIGVEPAAQPHDYGTDLPYRTTTLHRRRLPAPWTPRGPRWLRPGRWLRQRRRDAAVDRAAARLGALFRAARPGAVVIAAQVWAMEWVDRADTTGVTVIGMSHESYRASRASSRYRRVKRHFRQVDRFLLLTQEDADAWAQDGMSNAGVMPNPLPVTPVGPADLDAPVLTTLGRLSHEKGMDLLLEAWSLVAPQHPRWRLHVYGSGREAGQLRAQARALGLDPDAVFRGTTGDVDAALRAASIYVLPSRHEGFPVSVLEAMAYGLPVVGFDCAPGVRALVEPEGTGLLVAPGDVHGLAAGIERLVKDRDLRRRWGDAAREAVRPYHPDTILDAWEELFRLLER
jgi:glycosyltransferase involved in cell wall biosynthesis